MFGWGRWVSAWVGDCVGGRRKVVYLKPQSRFGDKLLEI